MFNNWFLRWVFVQILEFLEKQRLIWMPMHSTTFLRSQQFRYLLMRINNARCVWNSTRILLNYRILHLFVNRQHLIGILFRKIQTFFKSTTLIWILALEASKHISRYLSCVLSTFRRQRSYVNFNRGLVTNFATIMLVKLR